MLIGIGNGFQKNRMVRSLAHLVLAAVAMAGSYSTSVAAPRIHVVGGEQIDLGRGRPGRLLRELAITNAGDDTLTIISISSGCGCLIGEPDRRELGPGDTARVQITIETTGQIAEVWQKSLTIATNDPRRPIVEVAVRASFRHDVRLHSILNTVCRELCEGECPWTIELENIGEVPIVVQPAFAEEMRGLIVTFDITEPRTLAPGDTLRIVGRVKLIGGEEFPSARVLIATSSEIDSETYVAWFYAPDEK